MRITIFVLFLLSNLLFSYQVSSFSTGGEVITKPVLYDNKIVMGSYDGSLYSVNIENGARNWQTQIGTYILQPYVYGQNIIVATTSGKVTSVNKRGNIVWQLDLDALYGDTTLYGISIYEKIYVSTNRGVFLVTETGNSSLFYNKGIDLSRNNSILTPVIKKDNNLIFGIDDKVKVVASNGQDRWNKTIGQVWSSRPIVIGNIVYIGTLENKMYAFGLLDGFERWNAETKGWIMGTPYTDGDIIYFGSNDGYLYALNPNTGGEIWKTKLGSAIQSQPEEGTLGGRQVLFVGNNDNNLYAIDKSNGNILLKHSTHGWVHDPLFYNNHVIFGSHDGELYWVDTRKACSITSPVDGSTIGHKEVKITGSALSSQGASHALISVNSLADERVELDENGGWSYILNPTNFHGLVEVECKVVDGGGIETGTFSKITLSKDDNSPLGKFRVIYPASVVTGDNITIHVIDDDLDVSVDNFEYTIYGKSHVASGNMTLTMDRGGPIQLTIKKTGFEDKTITINVSEPLDTNLILMVVGGIVLLLLIAFIGIKLIGSRK